MALRAKYVSIGTAFSDFVEKVVTSNPGAPHILSGWLSRTFQKFTAYIFSETAISSVIQVL
jgi:hypothetical protein